MKIFVIHLVTIFLFTNSVSAQVDTIYFFNFENLKRYVDDKNVITTVNKGAQFRDAEPFLEKGGTTSHGSPASKRITELKNFNVGKTFLYHSPTSFLKKELRFALGPFKGKNYNHIELRLPAPLPAKQVYLISFVIGNWKSHKYKPVHYGIKFSDNRIEKEKAGGLMDEPDVLFPFAEDHGLQLVQSVFTSDEEIRYLYFGCFREDSTIVPKTFDLSDTPKDKSLLQVNDSLLTRVMLDNILITEMHRDPVSFRDVYFELDVDTLRNPADWEIVTSVIQHMKLQPESKLLLQGYTDNSGSMRYNLDLSRRRADSIKQYVMANGIAEERIITLGKGKLESMKGMDEKYKRKVTFLLFK